MQKNLLAASAAVLLLRQSGCLSDAASLVLFALLLFCCYGANASGDSASTTCNCGFGSCRCSD